jgi:uncharacterized protein
MKYHSERSRAIRFWLFALFLFLSSTGMWALLSPPAMAASAQDAQGNSKMVSITVGTTTIRAVVADTDATRIRGLLGWNSITEDTGMLLDFMLEGTYAIHMQGMKFPIDAIWIDSKGVIQWRYEEIKPNAGQIFPSMFPSRYCLEVAAGFCKKFGVKAGDKVIFAPAGQ